MPARRTAEYLCDRVRNHVGLIGEWEAYDRTKLRDGFAADVAEADRAILPALNEAIGKLLRTGQYKCRFTTSVPAGIKGTPTELTLDPAIGAIEYVKYQGRELQKMRIGTLDRQNPGWATTAPAAMPRAYYNDIPDVIGLWPVPLTADLTGVYSLEILAETVSDDLVLQTDIPERLPAQFHDDLAIWAAIVIIRSIDGGSEQSSRKIADLRRDWDGDSNPNSVLARVQALAQHREIDEVIQLVPYETRRGYSYSRYGGHY